MEICPAITFLLTLVVATSSADLNCIADGVASRCEEIFTIERNNPLKVPGTPKILVLPKVEGEIPEGSFKNLPQIEELEIHPLITYIEPRAFEGLKSIRQLNLFNNTIRYIVRGTFKGCETLKSLILTHNRINYIEAKAFEELAMLTMLDLSGNTEMRVLRDYTFSGLTSMTKLQCTLCGIYNIEPLAFFNATNLTELDLQSNFIGDLNGTEFEHLTHLVKLDLTANNIAHINIEPMLRNLRSLKDIVLLFNRINCVDTWTIENRFQRRHVKVHIRIVDHNRNQITTCLET